MTLILLGLNTNWQRSYMIDKDTHPLQSHTWDASLEINMGPINFTPT